jgi:drug/metabolite transporter (DMT)-like permease
MGSLLDTFSGLPVHALVVHAVVVLVPLAALGGIIMAVWRSFSRRFAPLVVIVAGMAAGSALVAKESGEKLATRLGGGPPTHMQLGTWMPIIAGALFILILVYWLVDRGIPLNRPRPLWLKLLGVALIVVALFAIFWTVRVGHTGSEAVWNQLLPGGG